MRLLRSGSRGADVRDLQLALKSAGLVLRVDGLFGPETDRVLRAFQEARGLTPDGVAGPRVWCALGLSQVGHEGPFLLGCDVSGHSGLKNWDELHERHVRFAFVRSSMGLGRDKLVLQQTAAIFALDVDEPIEVGLYHYLRADVSGEEQAGHFLALVDLVERRGGRVAVAVDLEDPSGKGAAPWDRPTLRKVFLAFRRVVLATGRVLVDYGPPKAMLDGLGLPEEVASDPLWLADYTPPADVSRPWKDWAIWQFKGGIDDWNRFRGTAEDFRRVMGLGA